MTAIEMMDKITDVTYFSLTDEGGDWRSMIMMSPVGEDGFRRGSDLLFWDEESVDDEDDESNKEGKFGIPEFLKQVRQHKENGRSISPAQDALVDNITEGMRLIQNGTVETYRFRNTVSKKRAPKPDSHGYVAVNRDYLLYDAIEDTVSGDWWVRMIFMSATADEVKIILTGDAARLFHKEFARVLNDATDKDFNVDNGDVHPIMEFMSTQTYTDAPKKISK